MIVLPIEIAWLAAGTGYLVFAVVAVGPAWRRRGAPLAGVAAAGFLGGLAIVATIKGLQPSALAVPRTGAELARSVRPDLLLGGLLGLGIMALLYLCAVLQDGLFVDALDDPERTPGAARDWRPALGELVPVVLAGLLGGAFAGLAAALSRPWVRF